MEKNEIRFPIETTREGNKITKTCVEDVHKIVNRIIDCMDKAHNKSVDIINSLNREGYSKEGKENATIFGAGISQPCIKDVFDEKLGNNIAFMKMKLNANIKKHNFINRIINNYIECVENIVDELDPIDSNIHMDLEGIRKHNPEYLLGIEDKLGLVDID